MANYRIEGFKFNRDNLRGIDADALKGINSYLSSRETAINTISTESFICAGGPFHGQPIELECIRDSLGMSHAMMPQSMPLTVGKFAGRYQVVKGENGGFAAAWCEGCAEPGRMPADTAFFGRVNQGAKPAKAATLGRGFVQLGQLLASMAELQDGEFARFTIGRTTFKVLNNPERIDELRARVLKAKKWYADKYLPEPREVAADDSDTFAADAVAELVASATAAAAIGQAMAPAVADARELETVGADCGPVEAATASDAIGPFGHAQTGHGGPAGHAGGPDFGVRGMGPDPVFRGPAADFDPEPVGITGTRGNIGTRGNSEKMPEPVGISNGGRPPEHYQYLPTWAKIAIERLDADSDLRNGAMLDQLLNAYAASNGQACDAHIRASSHHICGRRFWNFAPLPTDPAPNPEPAESVGIQAEPMEISAPLVDDTEPAGIPRNRETHSDSDYHDWIRGSISNFACARRVPYREAADIAELHWPRMRSEYLAGASVHDMCRILGEINPEPVEPVAIADGGPVVFNADRREWVHAGTIEPEPVGNVAARHKPSQFLWAWNDDELAPDPTMDRRRLARLLRAWRSHGGHDIKRTGRSCFRVTVVGLVAHVSAAPPGMAAG